MNNLSLLIYMSSVLPSLSSFLVFTVLIAGLAFVAFTIITIFARLDSIDTGNDNPSTNSAARAYAFFKPLAKLSLAYLLLGGIIASMIPSQKTILLIAASEVGEQVIKSKQFADTVDPSMEFIQEWIKKQTADLAAKK